MDTKALRQKILDLAIRGKLVPQNLDDEPASVLLDKIRAEKQQMVKDGRLKAKDIKNDTVIFKGEDNLHYEKFIDGTMKCIEDEIPFAVPEGWAWTRIATICILNPRNRIPDDLEVSFISMPMIAEGYSNIHSSETREWKDIKTGFTHFAENDICVAKITPCFENRKSVVLNNLTNDYGAGTTELYILRIVNHIIISEYLLWIVKTEAFISGGIQSFSGAVGQQRVSKEFILQYLVPVPPKQEQKRIVDKIDGLFTIIELIENSKTTLQAAVKQAKNKILDLAIRGKLVPQDPNDEPASVLLERIRAEKEELIQQGKIKRDKKESVIFKGDDNSYYEQLDSTVYKIDKECQVYLPSSWEYARLKTICTKIVDGSHNPPKGQNSKTNYIMMSSRNISDDKISDLDHVRYLTKEEFERENERTSIAPNDIILTTVGSLGRSCIYQKSPINICFQRSVTVISTLILPQYLKLYFDSPLFQTLINSRAIGTAQKGFYLNQLKDVIIPIPPINEQYLLISRVENLMYYLEQIYRMIRC